MQSILQVTEAMATKKGDRGNVNFNGDLANGYM